jgi:hypothetical protein
MSETEIGFSADVIPIQDASEPVKNSSVDSVHRTEHVRCRGEVRGVENTSLAGRFE